MRSREASDSPAAATTSWPAARERGGQDGADAAGADDAHPQPAGRWSCVMRRTFRSSPSDALG